MRPLRLAPLVLVVVAFTLLPSTAQATFAGANGTIAFTKEGVSGILLMDGQGLSIAQATTSGDSGAMFSPDGSRIAFVRWRQISPDQYRSAVFVVRTDGSNAHQVSGAVRGWGAQRPVWSPDGRWIAFEDFILGEDPTTHDETYRGALFVVHPDGSRLQRLTGYRYRNAEAMWSPDSQRIVFSRGTGKMDDIWSMNRDGTGQVRLTFTPNVLKESPQWSSSGDSILYVRASGDRRTSELFTMAPDGSDKHRMTHLGKPIENPGWSPDGTAIALLVMNTATGSWRLWRINSDGSGLRPLSPAVAGGVEYRFAWSPDSTLIACQMHGDIYSLDAASGGMTRLTATSSNEYVDDWQAR